MTDDNGTTFDPDKYAPPKNLITSSAVGRDKKEYIFKGGILKI